MTRTTTRSETQRTRPSARVQRNNSRESAPVLFRLPTIEVIPLAPADDVLANSSFRSFSVSPVSGSSTTSSVQTMPTSQNDKQTGQMPHKLTVEAKESDDSLRSWWEHWSSGVVMIVLAIVLVAVSLILFRLPRRSNDSTLATAKTGEEFGDLDSIAVPSIASLPNEAAAETPNEQGGLESLESPEVQPMATASLHEPTRQGAEAQQAAYPTLPPTLQQLELSLPAPSNSVTTQPVSTGMGQSPSLYDEASRQASQDNPAGPAATSPEAATGPGATPMISSMPNLGSGNPSNTPSTMPVSTSANLIANPATNATPSQTSRVLPNAPPSIQATATPDFNEEEIIRAYLELTRTTPSAQNQTPAPTQGSAVSPNQTTNRYQSK